MAKKAKKEIKGLALNNDGPVYVDKCIALDANGVPWVIDPEKGKITLAKIEMPATKEKAA